MRPARIFLAVLVASLALVYFEYRKDIDQARECVNAGSQIAQTNCGPIEYVIVGSGPPVLVVHGAGGGFDQGLAVARLLVEGGFQVIVPSRFGYLRSPMPDNRDRLAETQAGACLSARHAQALQGGRVRRFGGCGVVDAVLPQTAGAMFGAGVDGAGLSGDADG